jgi:hypothetical protein
VSNRNPTGEAFRQFQYPTPPLTVSNDFKHQTLRAALARVYGAPKEV